MYKRILNLTATLKKNNYFLFGPRATGKSSLIAEQLPNALVLDLLDDDLYESLLRRPKSLSDKIHNSTQLVVIDEIQKLPVLLDEVHRLIEKSKIQFLLTGSSARKLKRDGANMLGGRAREMQLFPLVYPEIPDFDLLRYLNFGGLPIVYKSDEPQEDLKAYVRVYLSEEIKKEAAVRNYERFVRFLETMAISNGLEINYAQLSSNSGVPARTIEGHLEVLKDTLLGFELLPFRKTISRKATTKSKFYFFDTGVANYLAQKLPLKPNHADIGTVFEQFIIQEVRAYISYFRKDLNLTFWRSSNYEVDLVVGDQLAIEVKFSENFKSEYLKGLTALSEESIVRKYLVVGRFLTQGKVGNISYLHYKSFLIQLWNHEFI